MTRIATVLALIVTFIATTAHAQLHWTDPVPKVFACLDKSDAYKLALADMLGTPGPLPSNLTEEGRCALVSATYLFTIDRYVDSDGQPSRVVEMDFYGRRVWTIFGSLTPKGVWLISHH